VKNQFQLTEQHFVEAGYRRNHQIASPADSMSGLVCQFYKPIKDTQGKRFTIQVKGYSMPANCPVKVVYEFSAQVSAEEPIGHLSISFGTGIYPHASTIEELEMKINMVWEKLGKNYMEYFPAPVLAEDIVI